MIIGPLCKRLLKKGVAGPTGIVPAAPLHSHDLRDTRRCFFLRLAAPAHDQGEPQQYEREASGRIGLGAAQGAAADQDVDSGGEVRWFHGVIVVSCTGFDLVDLAVAVVVEFVADLVRAGIHQRSRVVTVAFAGRLAVLVSVPFVLGNDRVTVVVLAVAFLDGARVRIRVGVVAVALARGQQITILVGLLISGVSVAVVVQLVAQLRGFGVCVRIRIVAVVTLRPLVSVGIFFFCGDHAVAVVVQPVADLLCIGVYGLLLVVAVALAREPVILVHVLFIVRGAVPVRIQQLVRDLAVGIEPITHLVRTREHSVPAVIAVGIHIRLTRIINAVAVDVGLGSGRAVAVPVPIDEAGDLVGPVAVLVHAVIQYLGGAGVGRGLGVIAVLVVADHCETRSGAGAERVGGLDGRAEAVVVQVLLTRNGVETVTVLIGSVVYDLRLAGEDALVRALAVRRVGVAVVVVVGIHAVWNPIDVEVGVAVHQVTVAVGVDAVARFGGAWVDARGGIVAVVVRVS